MSTELVGDLFSSLVSRQAKPAVKRFVVFKPTIQEIPNKKVGKKQQFRTLPQTNSLTPEQNRSCPTKNSSWLKKIVTAVAF